MEAWNGWYHVNGNTYGTWLPGDPRGWREKRHRKHVEGDYKNPPPKGSGDALLYHSRKLLKHPPVRLNREQQKVAGRAMVDELVAKGIEVLVLSMDAIHYHILARFHDKRVRPVVGLAKLNAYHRLRDQWKVQKAWERLSHVKPVTDRTHQVNVFNYILSHKEKGAWVWNYREGLYWRDNNK